MSWNRDKGFVHPYTYFLVNDGLSSIYDSIKEGNRSLALQKLYWLVGFLEPKIQDTLASEVEDMESMMQNINLLTVENFKLILWNVIGHLHEAGYFLAAKFGPPTKETKMGDLARKLEKAKFATR